MGGVAFWDSGVQDGEMLPASGRKDEAPRLLNALYSDHPWDTAWMAGKRLPGLCEVANGLTEIGVDMKKPDGADGSTITVKGYKPGKFEISCTVWTEQQWTVLQKIIALVWRRAQKGSKLKSLAFDVSHPALQLLGVHSCVVQAVTYPQAGKFEGSKIVQFKCIENVPAGKHSKTQTVSKVVVDPVLVKKGEAEALFTPVNGTPAKPSGEKGETGPHGPKARPAEGKA
jgi:hypothetical protein